MLAGIARFQPQRMVVLVRSRALVFVGGRAVVVVGVIVAGVRVNVQRGSSAGRGGQGDSEQDRDDALHRLECKQRSHGPSNDCCCPRPPWTPFPTATPHRRRRLQSLSSGSFTTKHHVEPQMFDLRVNIRAHRDIRSAYVVGLSRMDARPVASPLHK